MQNKIIAFVLALAFSVQAIPAFTLAYGGGGGGMPFLIGQVVVPPPIPQIQVPNGQVLGAAIFNFTRSLLRGSTGEDVKELQKVLIKSGHLKIDAPTGTFGSLTEEALKSFQKSKGLQAVGVVGPQTRALLNTPPVQTQTNAPSTMTESEKQTVIRQLQARLFELAKQFQTILAQRAGR